MLFQASSAEDAEDGMMFMQEMIELSKLQQQEGTRPDAIMIKSSTTRAAPPNTQQTRAAPRPANQQQKCSRSHDHVILGSS